MDHHAHAEEARQAPSYGAVSGLYLRFALTATGSPRIIGVYDQESEEEGILNFRLPTYEELRAMPFAEDIDALLKASYWLTRHRDRADSLLEKIRGEAPAP